jgi:hypothetical protein
MGAAVDVVLRPSERELDAEDKVFRSEEEAALLVDCLEAAAAQAKAAPGRGLGRMMLPPPPLPEPPQPKATDEK